MGSQLAREVSEHWGHLAAGPYKVLMRMALHALDTSTDPAKPAGHYWRGWRDLAVALGRKVPDDDDTSPQATTRAKTIKREVIRQTGELQRLGAVVKVVDNPGAGTRQVWKLTL